VLSVVLTLSESEHNPCNEWRSERFRSRSKTKQRNQTTKTTRKTETAKRKITEMKITEEKENRIQKKTIKGNLDKKENGC